MNNQYEQLLLTAIFAAKRAGEVILEIYNSDFAVEHKDDESPLTLADTRAHEVIVNNLQKPSAMNHPQGTTHTSPLPILRGGSRGHPLTGCPRMQHTVFLSI